jgi:ABC-type glutathione transport system ATPase component
VQALDDVNLTIESDEPVIVSLVGESGSGKTTLAKVILRLVEPTSGAVTVCRAHGRRARARGPDRQTEFLRTVQPIFQNPFEAFSQYRTSMPIFTKPRCVWAVTQARRRCSGGGGAGGGGYGVQGCARQVSQPILRWRVAARLGGPRVDPAPARLIVADEPVSMIDASRRMIIINLFLALKQEYQTSFLYITHDLATAYYISDYIAVMNKGRHRRVWRAPSRCFRAPSTSTRNCCSTRSRDWITAGWITAMQNREDKANDAQSQ